MTELYNIVTNIPQTVYLVLFTYILRPELLDDRARHVSDRLALHRALRAKPRCRHP